MNLERPSGEAVLGESPPADAGMEGRELGAAIEEELAALAPDRSTVVRPGLIVGPAGISGHPPKAEIRW